MPSETRTIDTGLTGPVNHAILDSVMGQLSDGKWENTPMMAKYWRNASIIEQGGKLLISIKDGWDSGFRGKDDAWVKAWFAGKIKEIVYDEFGGEKWSRTDTRECGYLDRPGQKVTVSDAYKAYEILKGRNIKNRYAADPAPAPAAPTAESVVRRLIGEAAPAKRGRKAIVTAAAVNRSTGEQIAKPRDEEIDLITNQIFKGCKTWMDVKEAYESFWNDLNPNSNEMVLVHGVKML
jgi:hypothetical protein